MAVGKQTCSGLDIDDTRFSAELRTVINALFCTCFGALESRTDRLARELFRRVELQDTPLEEAADALGVTYSEAREILTKVRREIAVALALGLCASPRTQSGDEDNPRGCGCGSDQTRSFLQAS